MLTEASYVMCVLYNVYHQNTRNQMQVNVEYVTKMHFISWDI